MKIKNKDNRHLIPSQFGTEKQANNQQSVAKQNNSRKLGLNIQKSNETCKKTLRNWNILCTLEY